MVNQQEKHKYPHVTVLDGGFHSKAIRTGGLKYQIQNTNNNSMKAQRAYNHPSTVTAGQTH